MGRKGRTQKKDNGTKKAKKGEKQQMGIRKEVRYST